MDTWEWSETGASTDPPGPERELTELAQDLARQCHAETAALQRSREQVQRLLRAAELLGAADALARLTAREQALEARAAVLVEVARLLTPEAAAATAAGSPAVAPSEGGGAATIAAPLELSSSDAEVAARSATPAVEPEALMSVGAATVRAAAPAVASWQPRPLDELETVRLAVTVRLEHLAGSSACGLAEFKAWACRFQGAALERQRHPGSQSDWAQLRGLLRDRQRELGGEQFCLPLSPLTLDPPEWEHLAGLFEDVAWVQETLDWIEARTEDESERWRRAGEPTLESCGAVLNRLWRWLQRRTPPRREPQQQALYERLCALTRRWGVYLRALQPEELVTDAELVALAAELPERLTAFRQTLDKAERKAAALAAWRALLAEPGWGAREGDDDRTCAAAAACLAAGVPATDRQLRDPLVEHEWLLEEDPAVSGLRAAVETERVRRENLAAAKASAAPSASEPAVPPELLAALHSHTAGRRAVIVGGQCREETRRSLAEALGFAELRWPSTEPSDTFAASRKEILRAELVFLTRFNRRKAREAYALCSREGKTLVVLPKGYGLTEVVHRLSQRLLLSSATT